MSDHTPGAWRAEKRDDAAFQYRVVGDDGLVVAYVAHANRHVVTAAPGLLAGGKALLARYLHLVESGDCGFWSAELEPEVKLIRAAIDKAEARIR